MNYNFINSDGTSYHTPAEINIENVRTFIAKKENPHPLTITIMALATLVIIYIIYILLVKSCISGEWVGQLGDQPSITYKITHNPFTDKINIYNSGQWVADGYYVGNIIRINTTGGKLTGMLASHDTILWIDSGDVWSNIKVLK